jgi:predicted enzyme related to lactoylglutathione lyase
VELKLIVIRTPEPQRLANFYTQFGLNFEYHKHGTSPYHFSTSIGKTILEIYPLTKSQKQADLSLRLGFEIEHFDKVLQHLVRQNIKIIDEPMQTEWGIMAIIKDPDGRKIELYKK